jgi:hypothetical protein
MRVLEVHFARIHANVGQSRGQLHKHARSNRRCFERAQSGVSAPISCLHTYRAHRPRKKKDARLEFGGGVKAIHAGDARSVVPMRGRALWPLRYVVRSDLESPDGTFVRHRRN